MIKEEKVKEFIKELKEQLIFDWNFCKKANVEPHIHPRRVIEEIDKLTKNKFGDLK